MATAGARAGQQTKKQGEETAGKRKMQGSGVIGCRRLETRLRLACLPWVKVVGVRPRPRILASSTSSEPRLASSGSIPLAQRQTSSDSGPPLLFFPYRSTEEVLSHASFSPTATLHDRVSLYLLESRLQHSQRF